MEVSNLYTELILEKSRDKKNRHVLDDATYTELGHNPSCGDEITLQVKLDGERIEDLAYTGMGCAISQASTSIMCDVVRGKSKEEAIELADKFIGMIKGEVTERKELKVLKDAVCFQSISQLPARVKCAVLSWYTLKNMLENEEENGSFSIH